MSVRDDIRAAQRNDPAARGAFEVWLTYSGLHAVWGYRLAHRLWRGGLPFLARVVSQGTRFLTGVEIHPGATIGRRLFIDHGMGVVIGETAVIGDDVLMYHGVTLGGKGNEVGQRHPRIGDRVVLGAGSTVLGGVTIGADSVVAAAAVVLKSAPPGSLLAGVPAKFRPRDGGGFGPATE
ncbi:serine O-acetyltransferase EpsC [Salinibacterium sp. ZJ454]|uniref:serine O-acetyltransferase EpsC n=1 Tax=Salinibacterium sp. ZJ454 TaxID=2708339 RepID=UPI00141F1747|nr:serine O-acetyltransferase EpsC [Salinibacterium sp. ZJ454]